MWTWLLRLALAGIGGGLGAVALDLQPAWVPNLHVPLILLGPFAAVALVVAAATFERSAEARNLAVLTGWTLCVAAIALFAPAVSMHWL